MSFGLDEMFSGALNWFGGEQQNRRAADAADQAQGFSASQFASRYQTTVNDMQAAGLNPMLAYSQGGGSPPSGVQANVPVNSGAAAVAGYQAQKLNAAQTDLVSAQAAKVRAETPYVGMLGDAEIGAKGASAAAANASVGQINANADKIRKELENMPSGQINGMSPSQWNTEILRRTADNLQAQAHAARERGDSEEVIRNQLRATIAKVGVDTALGRLDLKAAEDMGNIGREAGQLKPFIDLILSVLRSRR